MTDITNHARSVFAAIYPHFPVEGLELGQRNAFAQACGQLYTAGLLSGRNAGGDWTPPTCDFAGPVEAPPVHRRVARKLHEHLAPRIFPDGDVPTWEELGEEPRSHYEELATVALEALGLEGRA